MGDEVWDGFALRPDFDTPSGVSDLGEPLVGFGRARQERVCSLGQVDQLERCGSSWMGRHSSPGRTCLAWQHRPLTL